MGDYFNMNEKAFSWPSLGLPRPKFGPSFRLAFLTACLVGTITHLYLFTNLLLNHDSATQMYTANNVLSSGRWSLELLSLFSTYFQLPVVIGLISVLALAVTAGLTVQILELKHPIHVVLTAAFLVTFPSVASIFSYLFTADAYFICLALNATGVYCAKHLRHGWIAAIALITLACGTYQAFICYAIGLFLIDCILMLLNQSPLDKVIRRGLSYVAICVASLILYYIVLNILLFVTGTSLVGYQGLDRMSFANLSAFFQQIPLAYLLFGKHLLDPAYLAQAFRLVQMVFVAFFALLALYLVVARKLYREPLRLVLLVAGFVLIPLALNFVTVISIGAEVHQLMVYSFVLFFILGIKLTELAMVDRIHAGLPGWRPICLVSMALCSILIWGNFCTVNAAYFRLQLRYENTFAAANRIVARVEALDGYVPNTTPVALVGYLPGNLYGGTVSSMSPTAPITGTDDTLLLSYYSARSILEYCIGLHLPPMTDEQWAAVYDSGILDEMPCYPAPGSVILHEGVAVVKLNEI